MPPSILTLLTAPTWSLSRTELKVSSSWIFFAPFSLTSLSLSLSYFILFLLHLTQSGIYASTKNSEETDLSSFFLLFRSLSKRLITLEAHLVGSGTISVDSHLMIIHQEVHLIPSQTEWFFWMKWIAFLLTKYFWYGFLQSSICNLHSWHFIWITIFFIGFGSYQLMQISWNPARERERERERESKREREREQERKREKFWM